MSEPTFASLSADWKVPTELSMDEYNDLLQEIREPIDEDATSDADDAKAQQETWWSVWGPEWLDAARYNDMDVVRAILHVSFEALSKDASESDDTCAEPVDGARWTPLNTPLNTPTTASTPSIAHVPLPSDVLYYQDPITGNTALHMAAANGHVAILQLLSDLGHFISASSNRTQSLHLHPNAVGNTALHWAAANGQVPAVHYLLTLPDTDVLLQNAAGRSILTEGFASNVGDVMEAILSHASASEERLLSTSKGESDAPPQSVTHALVLGDTHSDTAHPSSVVVHIDIREWAMATSNQTSILGQDDPSHDTTGFSVWASSLICAQWMVRVVSNLPHDTAHLPMTILELGAGCGVPGLTLARALGQFRHSCRVVLTDFNPATVENLHYNVRLNEPYTVSDTAKTETTVTVQAQCMNWNDPSTWPHLPNGVDWLIGSDLLYQDDMVPLLVHTVLSLQPTRFYYVAHTARRGHADLGAALAASDYFDPCVGQSVPPAYLCNPLASLDDDACFVHFHELVTASASASSSGSDHGFVLYEYHRRGPADDSS